MALPLNHATKLAFLQRLRERFRAAERHETWRLASLIKNHYDAGDFTAAELRAAFGLTAQQLQALADKLTDYAQKWVALKATRGE